MHSALTRIPVGKRESVLGFHLERLILILRQQTSQNNKATFVDFGEKQA